MQLTGRHEGLGRQLELALLGRGGLGRRRHRSGRGRGEGDAAADGVHTGAAVLKTNSLAVGRSLEELPADAGLVLASSVARFSGRASVMMMALRRWLCAQWDCEGCAGTQTLGAAWGDAGDADTHARLAQVLEGPGDGEMRRLRERNALLSDDAAIMSGWLRPQAAPLTGAAPGKKCTSSVIG